MASGFVAVNGIKLAYELSGTRGVGSADAPLVS